MTIREPRWTSCNRSGHTLIEVIFVLGIAILVLLSIGAILNASQAAFTETITSSNVDDLVRRTLDRMVSELRTALPATFEPIDPRDAQNLTFSTIRGWDGSNPIPGPRQTITLDSGTVMMNGIPIAQKIKNLTFNLEGRILRINMTVERSVTLSGKKRLFTRSVESQLYL